MRLPVVPQSLCLHWRSEGEGLPGPPWTELSVFLKYIDP